MKFSKNTIKDIANLAKITVSDHDCDQYAHDLRDIFELINQMNLIDTDHIEPMYNPHDMSLRLRDDTVTEVDSRQRYQKCTSHTESGLYLVPKVIE